MSGTDSTSSPTPGCTVDTQAVLRQAFEAAAEKYGPLGLDFDVFVGDVLLLVRQRRERLGLPTSPADVGQSVASYRLADLFLARACEHGDERAWAALRETYEVSLVRLLERRGARGAHPEAVAAEVLSDLAMPAPRDRARTLIGTYEGAGSLWSWLAQTAVHRLMRSARSEKRAQELATRSPRRPAALPWEAAVEGETAAELGRALRDAWGTLEPEEQLAILWKHRDGLSQRQVGRLLGVRDYQVSRIVARAVAKLRGAVDRHVDLSGPQERSLWERLRLIVERHLATVGSETPHGSGDPP